MAYCKTRRNGIRNFFGGCNRSIYKAFVNSQICRASGSTALSVIYDLPMVSSTDDPTLVKANKFLELVLDYGQLGNYLVEFFTWMKHIPSSLASWKRLAEGRYEEYSHLFVGWFREVEDRIVMTFIRFSLPSRSPSHLERRGRTPELCWDIDSGTGAQSPERGRGRIHSCYNVVRIVLYLILLRIWLMITSISVAGAETVSNGLVSTIVDFFHAV